MSGTEIGVQHYTEHVRGLQFSCSQRMRIQEQREARQAYTLAAQKFHLELVEFPRKIVLALSCGRRKVVICITPCTYYILAPFKQSLFPNT
jgi:hypothetical protein